jgi:hypothetical protein
MAETVKFYSPSIASQAKELNELLRDLSDEDRLNILGIVMDGYCGECGCKSKYSYCGVCQNDE